MDFAHLTTQELTVSFGSSVEAKQQVKQATDIVDLVGRYVPLRRQGRLFVGLCPWHDDTRPSLQVDPERQSFKCWVCDIGGDVFSFVMKIEGVSFPEALAILADRAGIALHRVQRASGQAAAVSDKQRLYQAMAWAEREYHQCLLRDPEAAPARNYLVERGISDSSIAQFRIGFAPNRWDWLQRRAASAGFDVKVLETLGLVVPPSEGNHAYDRFRGRLLFSIRDAQGRPVAFGGRLLPESGLTSPAKYINSPETPLFTKSNQLYGLEVARDAIRRTRTAIVMEGYTDCIMAHQSGFCNAVAVLGTALGGQHVRILKRFSADRIVLVLDGDEAGRRRANEVLQLFMAEEVDLRVVTLPDDLDPCDFLQKRGPEAFRRFLEAEMVDAIEHKYRVSTRGLDVERDVEGVHRALEEMLALMASAPRLSGATEAQRRNREWKMLATLALRFRVPEEAIRQRLQEMRGRGDRVGSLRPGRHADPATPHVQKAKKLDPCDRELLELVLCQPACLVAARSVIRPDQLLSAEGRLLYETCCRLADAGQTPTFERVMLELEDAELKSLLVSLEESGSAKRPVDAQSVLAELAKSFQRRELSQRFPRTAGLLRDGRLDASQQVELLEQIVQQERVRHGLSAPTDG